MKVFRLRKEVVSGGIGIHSGFFSSIAFVPSAEPGIRFLKGGRVIPASLSFLHDTRRGVTLSDGVAQVKTVEHLLAAVRFLGISGVDIVVEGEEIPIMDGSALPWVELLMPHLDETDERFEGEQLAGPLRVEEGDAWISASPCSSLSVRYTISFPGTPVGEQTWEGEISRDLFVNDLSPARTFGFVEEVEALREQGLAMGGNLDTCVVITKDLILTPLRFKDEMIRHKVLDLLGDLTLLARIPDMKIEAYKASHRLHTRLAAKLESHA